MRLVRQYGIGPYYGTGSGAWWASLCKYPTLVTNQQRRVYEHRDWTVCLDRQHEPSKRFEVFVVAACGLWFVEGFYASPERHLRNWSDAERHARWLVDSWIETWGQEVERPTSERTDR